MIDLPPGFDPAALLSDFYALSAPFVGIATIIVAAVLLKRAMRK